MTHRHSIAHGWHWGQVWNRTLAKKMPQIQKDAKLGIEDPHFLTNLNGDAVRRRETWKELEFFNLADLFSQFSSSRSPYNEEANDWRYIFNLLKLFKKLWGERTVFLTLYNDDFYKSKFRQ